MVLDPFLRFRDNRDWCPEKYGRQFIELTITKNIWIMREETFESDTGGTAGIKEILTHGLVNSGQSISRVPVLYRFWTR